MYFRARIICILLFLINSSLFSQSLYIKTGAIISSFDSKKKIESDNLTFNKDYGQSFEFGIEKKIKSKQRYYLLSDFQLSMFSSLMLSINYYKVNFKVIDSTKLFTYSTNFTGLKSSFPLVILESKKRDLSFSIVYGIGIMNSRSAITKNVDLPFTSDDFSNLEGVFFNSSIDIESYIKFNKQVSFIMNFGYNQLYKFNTARINNILFQLGFLIKIKNENKIRIN